MTLKETIERTRMRVKEQTESFSNTELLIRFVQEGSAEIKQLTKLEEIPILMNHLIELYVVYRALMNDGEIDDAEDYRCMYKMGLERAVRIYESKDKTESPFYAL